MFQRPGESFGGRLLLDDRGQQPIQFGAGLGQRGERSEWVRGAAGVCRIESPGRRIPGAGQIAQMGCLGFLRALQCGVGVLDSGLDVGDQRRQCRDRVPDVAGGAVDRVE